MLRGRRFAIAVLCTATAVAGEHPLACELILPLHESSSIERIEQAASLVRERLDLSAAIELRLASDLESLTGRHIRYSMELDGRPVVGAAATLTLDSSARPESIVARVPPPRGPALLSRVRTDPRRFVAEAEPRSLTIIRTERVWYAGEDELIDAERTTVELDQYRAWHVITRRSSGGLLEVSPLFFELGRPARVFTSNPVQKTNDPSLRDENDSPTAVPSSAYTIVTLEGLDQSGDLSGENVTIRELSAPDTPAITASDDLTSLDRSDPRFESATAYFLVDSAQRHLQQLGYVGARKIIRRSIHVDPRALGGADSSFYIARAPGDGFLAFGVGGTDDAEDADIVHHEFAHAIQDAIAPGSFGGPSAGQARALGEGFGDYWAFSAGWADSRASGRDPFCIAEWDARCYGSDGCAYDPEADCLRRVDTDRTMADYRHTSSPGVQHMNGEIWSSALRRIFVQLTDRFGDDEGRRRADTLALEGHFGIPPSPGFATVARRMLRADAVLYAAKSRDILCESFLQSGILAEDDCLGHRISAWYPASGDLVIPDRDPRGITVSRRITDGRLIEKVFVSVDVAHPQRGDLKILLTGPDGTPVRLLDTGFADVSSGLRVTFGLDTEPVESLDVFRGRPASGTWTLQIVDARPRDEGVLRSWAIGFQFADDAGAGKRAGERLATIPVVVAASGVGGRSFSSDLALTAGSSGASVDLWLGPSSTSAAQRPVVVSIFLEPSTTTLVEDLVRNIFGTGGGGTLDVRLRSGDARAWSGIRSRSAAGSAGEQITPAAPRQRTQRGDRPLAIPGVSSAPPLRTNLGLAEIGGSHLEALVRLYDPDGTLWRERRLNLEPWQHVQEPLEPGASGWIEISVIGGEGALAAHASILGPDAIAVVSGRAGQTERMIAPAIAADGAAASSWRTDLHVVSASRQTAIIDLALRNQAGEVVKRRQVAIPALQSFDIDDSVRRIFGAEQFVGYLELQTTAPVTAHVRVVNDRPDAESVQVIDFEEQGLRSALLFPFQIDSEHRTNLLLTESLGEDAVVNLTMRAAGGHAVHRRAIRLSPRGTAIVPLPASGAATGRVELEVAGAGEVISWLSIVNNGSGDAVTVSPVPAMR